MDSLSLAVRTAEAMRARIASWDRGGDARGLAPADVSAAVTPAAEDGAKDTEDPRPRSSHTDDGDEVRLSRLSLDPSWQGVPCS